MPQPGVATPLRGALPVASPRELVHPPVPVVPTTDQAAAACRPARQLNFGGLHELESPAADGEVGARKRMRMASTLPQVAMRPRFKPVAGSHGHGLTLPPSLPMDSSEPHPASAESPETETPAMAMLESASMQPQCATGSEAEPSPDAPASPRSLHKRGTAPPKPIAGGQPDAWCPSPPMASPLVRPIGHHHADVPVHLDLAVSVPPLPPSSPGHPPKSSEFARS